MRQNVILFKTIYITLKGRKMTHQPNFVQGCAKEIYKNTEN